MCLPSLGLPNVVAIAVVCMPLALLSWARARAHTHAGGKTDKNAHPHMDFDNRIALVHNGTINNAHELRGELQAKGIDFRSETDSEVRTDRESVRYGIHTVRARWFEILFSGEIHKPYSTRIGSKHFSFFSSFYVGINIEKNWRPHFFRPDFSWVGKKGASISCQRIYFFSRPEL